ncbi:hypothetical protein ACFY9N_09520 [Microbacterium sp. NPDC008134]|uniref:hypothetical protein n=1 Tax=Microbacterium sp. NPDC008134 TaxID=3364183 RepID=UPI0036EBAA49
MSTPLRRRLLWSAAAATALATTLAACAAGPGSGGAPTSSAGSHAQDFSDIVVDPPEGPVRGTGTVLDVDGDTQFCLGAVAESYPPQCTGVPLLGWSWDRVDGSETSGGTTWGAYAVTGQYDGESITVTDPPILLALYDPMRPVDPTGGVDGEATTTELTEIQDDLSSRLGTDALALWSERSYVWVQVVWDDGQLQQALDSEYGEGTVIVLPALSEIDAP